MSPEEFDEILTEGYEGKELWAMAALAAMEADDNETRQLWKDLFESIKRG